MVVHYPVDVVPQNLGLVHLGVMVLTFTRTLMVQVDLLQFLVHLDGCPLRLDHNSQTNYLDYVPHHYDNQENDVMCLQLLLVAGNEGHK